MNQPVRGAGGVIYSSALGVRTRGSARPFTARGAPYRAVVLETYVMGDPDSGVDPSENAGPRVSLSRVEADVVLIRSGTILRRVPVVPDRWGVNDAQPWIPRKTTRTISNNEPLTIESVMSLRGDPTGTGGTPLNDIDGDIVLVEFIEEDIHFPFIRNAYPHPQSKRPCIEGTGWDEGNNGSERGTPHDQEHYFRFAGFEMRINEDGDLLLDTVGSTSDKVNEDPATGGGQIRVRVKNTERFTVEMDGTDTLEVYKSGSQVRIDLGDGANQKLVLGDDMVTAFDNFRTALSTWIGLVKTACETAPSGTLDNTAFTTAISALGTELSAALSDLARTKKT